MKKLFLAFAAAALIAGTIVVAQQKPAQQKPADKKPVPECSNKEQVTGKSCCMPSKASAIRSTAKPADKH
ncbi:hypothetical protein [Chitinophaga cymbidii]|uniref:hypothetical protein n=1 Tax=Chitinophaga cymbidii TaxID=1096750 RepID=UPI0011BE4B40|nr:hypothetical protein [Chitinophaga cymbidii]